MAQKYLLLHEQVFVMAPGISYQGTKCVCVKWGQVSVPSRHVTSDRRRWDVMTSHRR